VTRSKCDGIFNYYNFITPMTTTILAKDRRQYGAFVITENKI